MVNAVNRRKTLGLNDLHAQSYDDWVNAQCVILTEHAAVHDGRAGHFSARFVNIANGGSVNVLLIPTAVIHLNRVYWTLEGGVWDIFLYEDTTVSANGTPMTVYNTNRISTHTFDMGVYHTPTVTTVGTQLHTLYVPPTGAGVGGKVGEVNASYGEEWILAPNKLYLMRATNNSGSVLDAAIEGWFYDL